jgi:hypothetical protein
MVIMLTFTNVHTALVNVFGDTREYKLRLAGSILVLKISLEGERASLKANLDGLGPVQILIFV